MKIVYRVVTAVMAFCIIPNILYNTLIRLVYAAGKNLVESKLSVMKMIDLFGEGGMLHGVFDGMAGKESALRSIIPYGIASGVLLALAVLICLSIGVINIIKPMQKTTLILCGCGTVLTIAAMMIFNRSFAGPLMDGTISISDLVGGGFLGMLASLFSGIKVFQLGTAATMTIIIFIAIAVWVGAYMVTDLGAEDKK